MARTERRRSAFRFSALSAIFTKKEARDDNSRQPDRTRELVIETRSMSKEQADSSRPRPSLGRRWGSFRMGSQQKKQNGKNKHNSFHGDTSNDNEPGDHCDRNHHHQSWPLSKSKKSPGGGDRNRRNRSLGPASTHRKMKMEVKAVVTTAAAPTITDFDPDYSEATMSKGFHPRPRSVPPALHRGSEDEQQQQETTTQRRKSTRTIGKGFSALRRGSRSSSHKKQEAGVVDNNDDDHGGDDGNNERNHSSFHNSFDSNILRRLSSRRKSKKDVTTTVAPENEEPPQSPPPQHHRQQRRRSSKRDLPRKNRTNYPEFDFDFYDDDDDENNNNDGGGGGNGFPDADDSKAEEKTPRVLLRRRFSKDRSDAELLRSPNLEEELLKRNDRRGRRSSLKKKLLPGRNNHGGGNSSSGNNNNHHRQQPSSSRRSSSFHEDGGGRLEQFSDRDSTSGRHSCEVAPPESREFGFDDYDDDGFDALGVSIDSSVAPSHNLKDEEVMMLLYHELQMAMEQ